MSPALRPRLLDLFCGAGGAAMGYNRAGFDVVGVDIRPQPRYPFTFCQGDALAVLRTGVPSQIWDVIHVSPMCRDHTPLTSVAGTDGSAGQLASTRDLLRETGLPWVIENVPGAPMRPDLKLCGKMFGLRV